MRTFVVVKQEEADEADKVPVQEVDGRKGKKNASNKRPANVVVRRSERLKQRRYLSCRQRQGWKNSRCRDRKRSNAR